MIRTNARRTLILPVAALAALALGAGPASAAHGAARAVKSGQCSAGSTWTLKLKTENAGKLGVEFEVDQNRNGVPWTVKLARPASAAFLNRRYVTAAPSGSFTARALIANRAGVDTVIARATRAGESCSARISL